MTMAARIIRFDRDTPLAEVSLPTRVLAGSPVTTLYNYHSDADDHFFTGVWESTPGKWEVVYTEEEFCVILSGRIVLTDEEGHAEAFGPGDAFVIPAGFTGTWETVEPVRKLYAIYDR
ncbi:MAG: hypothetical protein NFCOHLIN_02666 [Gammaproteobacteria bacterium]|nr:hypothetical protein [Gammaproteobacteria bacterium]